MDLHLNYENITTPNPSFEGGELKNSPFEKGGGGIELRVTRLPLETMLPKRKNTGTGLFGKNEGEKENEELLKKLVPEIKLRVREGVIEIDELTSISGIPAEAWEYKLGNRSAIEWVLDQYKPYKSQDATIQAKFNNYNFFDYKEQIIKLLLQVIVVSVETMRIVRGL
jgi:predicted helicase